MYSSCKDFSGRLSAVAAHKIEDSYAILKIQNFEIQNSDATDIWNALSLAAKDRGITKLIVDISGNNGGNILAGNSLAVAMFPRVQFQWFDDQYDLVYNIPMRVYVDRILPLIGQIGDALSSWSDAELQKQIDQLTPQNLSELQTLSSSMLTFCRINCKEEVSGDEEKVKSLGLRSCLHN